MKRLLQIFCSSFIWSYVTSNPTLNTALMRSTEFKRVQFPSLLFSTLLCSRQRKHERFETSSSIVCCRYSLSYCISPMDPNVLKQTIWLQLSSPSLAGIWNRDPDHETRTDALDRSAMASKLIALLCVVTDLTYVIRLQGFIFGWSVSHHQVVWSTGG